MPEFHGDGLRTYITSYPLPALPEFDKGDSSQNPREAPAIALPEEIRTEMHKYMADGLMLPAYDCNHIHTEYSKIVAKPGEPLQVHFMVWTQHVMHDMDLPEGEEEFLDLRIELSCNGQIIDIGYISHTRIKPNGLPVGIEFVGQRCGDARETPLFFTVPTNPSEGLRESVLNILVTVGRISDFLCLDATKAMSKMVRMGPYHGKYESSTLDRKGFTGYIWRKEHQNLIRVDRAINPKTKLYAWKRKWMENDVYRLGVERRAYERFKKELEELEKKLEREAKPFKPSTNNESSIKIMEEIHSGKKVKRVHVDAEGSITSAPNALPIKVSISEASNGRDSPYSFRRARRSTNSNSNIPTITSSSPVSSSPTNKTQHGSNQQLLTPSSRKTQTPRSKSSSLRFTKKLLASTVYKGDPQQPSSSNVTFGKCPYKTTREYYREFIPYQDLCRIQYLVENPKDGEVQGGSIELKLPPMATSTRELNQTL
ncbi:hypothetical protein AOL_s00193g51 [Orbilia oligospora ATCC 24927]|uniref:Uncharacterized protein n=1 Tax=Arthrobotrys oligospora (strain ATCC 24927 / CBS 115.81 / DSM 1491) TaxID=756982 RepID=G1XR52_ARTOA|nr:hypothetical protein AOL_s00193g51 [Orbilia oligospora ATCC 24927]EGX44323.1 hypothetical protein AOL_s00193g51 [Orbilia oligospora ATCC 24927]